MEGFNEFDKKKQLQQKAKTRPVDECVSIDQQEGLF